MEYFEYTQEEIDYLSKRDKILGKEIARLGFLKREVNLDYFDSLVTQIISQLISKKAAISVKAKLESKVEKIGVKEICALSVEDIKSCGMSYRKAENIKEIARRINDDEFDIMNLENLTNEEVIIEMVKLPGIGKWTAQMFLMFTLLRKDVISYDDLAIRNGMKKVYKLDELSKKEFNKYEEKYGKYASIAAIYLWHVAHEK